MRHVHRARGLVRLALLPALLLALPATAAAADLQVRNVDTSRLPTVRLTVTAPDGARRPAFEVRENGVPLPAGDVAVQRPSGRMAVSLVIDSSHTMRGRPLAEALAAAREFVGRKRPDDEIAVFAFGSEVATAQPLTADGVRLREALDGIAISARQGTRLHDGIAAGLRELVGTPATTRRVLIVLADGEDNASSTTTDALRAAAVRDQVSVYAIAIKSSVYDLAALETIAGQTGGSSFEAETADLRDAYRSIGEELARTYVLSYPSTAPDRVAVEVRSGEARARSAYLAPPVHRPTTGGGLVPEAVTRAAWSAPLLAALTLVLVLAGLLTTVLRPRPRRSLPQLLAPYAATRPADRAERSPAAPSVSFLRHVAQSTERVLGDLRFWRSIARTLERSDLPLRTPELFYLMIGAGLLLGLLATVLGAPTLVALAALLLGGLVPLLVVGR